VPECGSTPSEMLAALRRGLYFQSVALTREDLERHASYRSNVARKELERSAGWLEEFLAGLGMTARHGQGAADTLPRVTQLINKTNQFNLTTRRYTEEQVRAMIESADWWCRWFQLADRFGDHGLIGVILARRRLADCPDVRAGANGTVPLEHVWTIDTWLMSCRVLGRQMENFMASALLSAAAASGADAGEGEYLPTAKNVLVQDLLPQLGFEPRPDRPGTFRYDLRARRPPICEFIRDESAPQTR